MKASEKVRVTWAGIKYQWDGVPDQTFMVLVLDESAVAGVRGVARYRDAFDEAM